MSSGSTAFLSDIPRIPSRCEARIVPLGVLDNGKSRAMWARRSDMGRQALAFLPNELWIHAGDSVTWTRAANESHTVSFLTPDQLLPAGPHSNDVITPDGSPFDGSSYVNSGNLRLGQTSICTWTERSMF